MALSGVGITVCYYAWDTVTSVGKTGDASNHTLRLSRDGVTITPGDSPVEVDGTNCPGLYRIDISPAEHTGVSFTLHGKSSSSGVVIVPRGWTTENGRLNASVASRSSHTTGDINTALSAAHGAGAWGGSVGANDVTITVVDQDTDPLPDATVAVLNSDESVVLWTDVTDSNGQAGGTLDNGSYKVRIRKAGYSFTTPLTLTVSGDTEQQYAGTAVSPSAPAPGMQTLYGDIITLGGIAADAIVEALTLINPTVTAGPQIVSADPVYATPNASGRFEISLVRGATVRLTVKSHAGKSIVQKDIVVTADATRNISAYLS